MVQRHRQQPEADHRVLQGVVDTQQYGPRTTPIGTAVKTRMRQRAAASNASLPLIAWALLHTKAMTIPLPAVVGTGSASACMPAWHTPPHSAPLCVLPQSHPHTPPSLMTDRDVQTKSPSLPPSPTSACSPNCARSSCPVCSAALKLDSCWWNWGLWASACATST